MTAPLVVLGDDIPVLRELHAAPALGEEAPRTACGVVWGADLTGLTARAARSKLKAAATKAVRAASHHPGASHLIIVFAHDALHRDEAYWTATEAIASRLHARLELARGREWDVIVLDASRCDDAGLLHARLRDAATRSAGSVGNASLEWHDIRDQPIHRAAARHAL